MLTEKYFHHPKIDHSADTNVSIIGIGYTKTLRDQWHSVNYRINPLVAAIMPDLDRMKYFDYERNENVAPRNAFKRDFGM